MCAHPARFIGFASLALKDANTAAGELDRCVSRLGLHGALVDGTTGGLFLDDSRFLPGVLRLPRTWEFRFICIPPRRQNRFAKPTSLAFPCRDWPATLQFIIGHMGDPR